MGPLSPVQVRPPLRELPEGGGQCGHPADRGQPGGHLRHGRAAGQPRLPPGPAGGGQDPQGAVLFAAPMISCPNTTFARHPTKGNPVALLSGSIGSLHPFL